MTGPEDLWMPCADGIRLATRLWRPPGAGPAPVLLMRQPYGRAIASTVTYAHPAWYASHGFLVAIQDVRGRGDSEGEFSGFAQEARDGAEAVRWARRLPGANGKVGVYGFSYQGLTQLLIEPSPAAATASGRGVAARGAEPCADPLDDPLPDCLAPACCGVDERLHWASEGGAHWWGLGLAWALQLAAEGCRRRGDQEGWRQIRSSLDSGAFLRDGLDLLQRHDPDGMGLNWLRRDPLRPQGWRRHEPPPSLLRRPLLLIAAWHDPHLRGSLDLWRRARRAGGEPWLRIGAWSHLDWRGGLDQLQLAFFRAHLPVAPAATANTANTTGPDGGDLDPQRLAQRCALQAAEDGPWRQVARQQRLAWRLHSDGLAAVRSDEGLLIAEAGREPRSEAGPALDPNPPALVLVHDPWRAVPGRGGHLGLDAGMVAREDLDRRADVACFSSAPLTQRLRLQGVPQLAIVVQADQPGFDLCAALSLLAPDGRAWQLSSGVARFLGDHCLTWRRRRLQLQPLLRELEPGQRLRLSLAAAAWPQIGVNRGDGSPWAGAVGPAHRQITLRFDLRTARLWLTSMFGAN